MRLESVPPFRMDEFDYVLGVERNVEGEVRRLYERGKEVRRWESRRRATGAVSEEREYAGEDLVSVRVMDAGGNLQEESEYKDGAVSVRTLFEYVGRRLTKLSAYDADGVLLYSEDFMRGKGSSLREVSRTMADGTVVRSSFRGDGADLAEETHTSGDVEFRVLYDVLHRKVASETRKAGVLAVRQTTVYRGDSSIPESSLEEWPVEKKSVERSCDEEGRIVRETVSIGEKTVEENDFRWDGDGRKAGRRRRSDAGIEEWAWIYGPDGSVEREEYLLRGRKEKVTVYGQAGERMEELYRDGELFLKVWYVDDQRVKEEVYEKGTLLRERRVP